MNRDPDEEAIRAVIKHYFLGTHNGNAEELKKAYHPDVQIFGSIGGKMIHWTLSQFIERVTQKPTAAEKHEKYDKEILSLDRASDIAIVKARVSAGGLHFTDFITLMKMGGKWQIRCKCFTA
jgi:putative lumazine-binding protein